MNVFDPMSKVDVVPECGSDIDHDRILTKEEGDKLLRDYINRTHSAFKEIDRIIHQEPGTMGDHWYQYEG